MSQLVFPAGGLRRGREAPRGGVRFPCPIWRIARVWLPRRHPGVWPGQCCCPARQGMVPPQPLNPRPWASSTPAGLPGALGRAPQHCRLRGARRARGNPPGGSSVQQGQSEWHGQCGLRPAQGQARQGHPRGRPACHPAAFPRGTAACVAPSGDAGATPRGRPRCMVPPTPPASPAAPGSGQRLEPGVAGAGRAAAEVESDCWGRGPGHGGPSTWEAGHSWWGAPSVTGHGDRSRFQQEQGTRVLA